MARMRNGSTTDDYRAALSGEGEIGSLGYEWSDKPHRLVYDLCGEVDHLRSIVSAALPALEHHHVMTRGGPAKSVALAVLQSARSATE